MRNVYVSPQQMLEKIVDDIRFLEANPQEYEALSTLARERLRGLYRFDEFKDNLKRFYQGEYDFWPDPPGVGQVGCGTQARRSEPGEKEVTGWV